MAGRFARFAASLGPRVRRVGERLPAVTALARKDPALARGWLRNVGPLAEAVGETEAAAYTRLVMELAAEDPGVARIVAHSLPDHIARVHPTQRGRYLALLRAVMADRREALPLVVRTLPELLPRLDDASIARFLAQGLDLHSASAQKAESFLKLESDEARREASRLQRGLPLDAVQRTLTHYARAHCGESVQVRAAPDAAGARAFTDGRHVFLPPCVDRFGDERDRLVYRVLTARNAGFIEFGTLDLDLALLGGDWPEPKEGELDVERLVRAFPNASLARDLFGVLESRRVEARVRVEYPGIARDMDRLAEEWRAPRPDPAGLGPAEQAVEWLARLAMGLPAPFLPDEGARKAAEAAVPSLERVARPGATVEDSARALLAAYPPIDALLRRVDESALQRLDGEREPAPPRGDPRAGGGPSRPERRAYQPLAPDPDGASLRTEDLPTEERSVEERARDLLEAMRARGEADASLGRARAAARREGASYEEMADFLDRLRAPAGPAQEEAGPREEAGVAAPDREEGDRGDALDAVPRPRAFLLPEWDVAIGDHKPDWVRLTEYDLQPGSAAFVDEVRRAHGPLIAQVRRSFEALRPEEVRKVKGLTDGDEIDIDRAIQARTERRAGGTPSDRIYTRHLRERRDVAVAFLVDMSSSTNEVVNDEARRVIDVEKEALVLIAEAVDAIGDACAVWGFSGYGRDQVGFYVAKDFADRWDDRARERIGRISWRMENRDGAAIRHATRKLVEQRARVRLLLLLSDGKPLDCGCDHYADRYAQEDTRMALREARRQGIHPFCITVDPQGPQYLARMYGEVGYTVIDRVESLPVRLPLIYRRLTR